MLHFLGGGSDEDPAKYYGRKIIEAGINDERLLLKFEDGVSIKVWDDGQSCCEHRYITCDDNVQDLVGGILTKIESKEGDSKEEDYETHEWCFVDIVTDKATITMCTHNEHNGYYGGFGLLVTEIV
jgi:hypothetical protein